MTDCLIQRVFFLSLLFTVAFTGCAKVPFNGYKMKSVAITETGKTRLGRETSEWVDRHQGLSGFFPLYNGIDALGVRLHLAEEAEKSIDIQCFLMKNDSAGLVITNSLLKAADRGVRVRLLLDDIFTTASDHLLLIMNQHPNIQVRLFNPISRHGFPVLNFLGDFERANRRMHNKSFTVDNQISVVGGRNIADEYFDLKTEFVFVDFDVMAMGPIASDVSTSFDNFWNHSRAVPIDQITAGKSDENLETLRDNIADEFNGIYDTVYRHAIDSQLLADLLDDRQPIFPAEAVVLSDSPDKLINKISEEQMILANNLREILLSAEKEIIFISPYYVPGKAGVQFMQNLIDNGIRVLVLTNSLASNNHIAVHGGYSRYRKKIIKIGAELNETRANAAHELSNSDDGPEALTLHTKAFLIDRRYLFVGSLNLDPRSIEINAEMGILIDSPEIITDIMIDFDQTLSKVAYRVVINDKGELEWHGHLDGEYVIETKEPLASWWLRFKAWFFRIAPENQL